MCSCHSMIELTTPPCGWQRHQQLENLQLYLRGANKQLRKYIQRILKQYNFEEWCAYESTHEFPGDHGLVHERYIYLELWYWCYCAFDDAKNKVTQYRKDFHLKLTLQRDPEKLLALVKSEQNDVGRLEDSVTYF